jgi:hypothetical protein
VSYGAAFFLTPSDVYLILVYVPTLPLGEPRRRREDNIQMDLKETGWEGMD